MVTTAHDLQRERLLAAIRLEAVADAAGVAFPLWSSTTSPRVLVGDAEGYVAGLHRGRLPAVEIFPVADEWDRQTASGGLIASRWAIRAHVAELGKGAADSRARAILCVALAAIRSDDYLGEGGERFSELRPGPLGHTLTVELTLAHSFCRSTYETDAVITPGDPVVVLPGPGGNALTVAWDEVSPRLVLSVPEGQAINRMDIHIIDAWDGSGASLTVGDAVDPAAFFAASDVELDTPGVTFSRDFDRRGVFEIVAHFTGGVGATQGRARVQVSVTRSGV